MTYIIVLIGINDINSNMNSSLIILAYKQIIEEAHKNNLFIYAGQFCHLVIIKSGIKKKK